MGDEQFWRSLPQRKSVKKQGDAGYEVKRGPDFADEALFEQELDSSTVEQTRLSWKKKTALGGGGDEKDSDDFDDDFDDDFGDDDGDGPTNLVAASRSVKPMSTFRTAGHDTNAAAARNEEEAEEDPGIPDFSDPDSQPTTQEPKPGQVRAGDDAAATEGEAAHDDSFDLASSSASLAKLRRQYQNEAAAVEPGDGADAAHAEGGTIPEDDEDAAAFDEEDEEDDEETESDSADDQEEQRSKPAAAPSASSAENQQAGRPEEDEWDIANKKFAQEAQKRSSLPKKKAVLVFIKYAEALGFYRERILAGAVVDNAKKDELSDDDEEVGVLDDDWRRFSKGIVEEDFSCYNNLQIFSLKTQNRWPPAVSYAGAVEDRMLFFSIAKVPLLIPARKSGAREPQNGSGSMPPVHNRILQTIYGLLNGTTYEVPRSGSHFVAIGFQGSSPHTDLRSTGMLSLVQMLFFLGSHFQVADDIFSLSQDTVHGFPFMVVGIRMTLLVMHVVREGRLSYRMNERQSLFGVANELYCAFFYKLMEVWQTERCSIADFDRVLKGLEAIAADTNRVAKLHQDYYAKVQRHGKARSK